ncbi:MAG: helix-turn-helix transcriptional regulator [Proteobacteria bacterium]|nr:helix-turn-helix transcriptional regulator [Pseudomonadota bacterium]
MRPVHHPAAADFDLASVLYALGDTVRLGIARRLAGGREMSCAVAAGDAERLPKSTLSFHFKVLRDAGLIRTRKSGVMVMSTLRRAELDARFPGLLASVLGTPATGTQRRRERKL